MGRALTLELAARGWDVIVTARTQSDVDSVVAAGAPHVRAVVGSVRSEEHRARLAELAGDSLDLLVNNASHLGPSPLAEVASFSPDELHAVCQGAAKAVGATQIQLWSGILWFNHRLREIASPGM